MSVKRIRLYIKVKRKIHDNVGHKEHNTLPLQPRSLFVNLPQILTPHSNPNCRTSTSSHSHTGRSEEQGCKLHCKYHICSTIVYFDLLNSNVNNNHAINRFFLCSACPFCLLISFLKRFGPYSGHGLFFHEASR